MAILNCLEVENIVSISNDVNICKRVSGSGSTILMSIYYNNNFTKNQKAWLCAQAQLF